MRGTGQKSVCGAQGRRQYLGHRAEVSRYLGQKGGRESVPRAQGRSQHVGHRAEVSIWGTGQK